MSFVGFRVTDQQRAVISIVPACRRLRQSGSSPENAQQPHLADRDALLYPRPLCLILQSRQGEWSFSCNYFHTTPLGGVIAENGL